jgi:ADP-ribose pyrophosphatase YjhB (NUDIX family)
VHFGEFSIGVGGVVMREGKALLVQRGWPPNRGAWQIPGGYVEHDEEIHRSVEREVLEEAGIEAIVQDLIGFRHALGGVAGNSTNIYLIFRLEAGPGEPVWDDDEIIGAGFFSMEELAQMERVQGLSLWAIRLALRLPPAIGLHTDVDSDWFRGRPGNRLFGLRPD